MNYFIRNMHNLVNLMFHNPDDVHFPPDIYERCFCNNFVCVCVCRIVIFKIVFPSSDFTQVINENSFEFDSINICLILDINKILIVEK